MVWPIVSIILGLIIGSIFGVLMTVLVFIYTAIRTPMHIVKMMYVTATTDECFKRRLNFDPLLRIVVFCLVPIVHVLWLGGVTGVALTCGTLYYISKATQMFYLHKYKKVVQKIESNAKLDKHSFFGSYVEACQEFMKHDDQSYVAINALKGICAVVPGLSLGILPLIPYTLGVVLITIYRLPVNFYKTMKIAVFTVVLKWDLKLAALIMLPFAHILFPLVALVTAMIGSFCYFTFQTTRSIANGKSPFEKWDKVEFGLRKYYRAHQEFVGKNYCDRYDHPTGIPSGWEGQSYGIPIQRVLRWQWNFMVCCFLLLVGFPICLVGSFLIFTVKLVPGTISWCRILCKEISEQSAGQIMGSWTFYLLAFILMPVGAILASLIAIAAGTSLSFTIPGIFLKDGYKAGFYAPFGMLHSIDGWDFFDLGDECYVLLCLRQWAEDTGWGRRDEHEATGNNRNNNSNHTIYQEQKEFSDAYWDRFANQCIRSTSGLLAMKWITLDDVKSMDPSVIQAIPAVAILEVLRDTVMADETKDDDIWWTIDDTLCKGEDRPQLENVAAFLLPRVVQIKRSLSKKTKKVLCEAPNIKIITAMLCSNTDDTTDTLEEFITAQNISGTSQPHCVANKHIRSKLIELSLAILQVKPFQDRMAVIFDYGYIEAGSDAAIAGGHRRTEEDVAPTMDEEVTTMGGEGLEL